MSSKVSPFAASGDIAQSIGTDDRTRLTAFGHPLADPTAFSYLDTERETDGISESPRRPTLWTRFCGQIVEDLAAYSLALHPPMYPHGQRQVDPNRYAIQAASPTTREIEGWINASVSNARDHELRRACTNASWIGVDDENTPPAPRREWLGVLTGGLVRLWKYLRREYAISRAVSTLSRLDDRELKDIGVDRGRLEHVVRYGRHND